MIMHSLVCCVITFTIAASIDPFNAQLLPIGSHIMGQLHLPIPIPFPLQSQAFSTKLPVTNALPVSSGKKLQNNVLTQRGRTVMVPFDGGMPIVIELPPHVFSLNKESRHKNSFMRGIPSELRNQLPFILSTVQQFETQEEKKAPEPFSNTFGIPRQKPSFPPLHMPLDVKPRPAPLPIAPSFPKSALKVPQTNLKALSFTFGDGKTRIEKMNAFYVMKPMHSNIKEPFAQQKITLKPHAQKAPQFNIPQQQIQPFTEENAIKTVRPSFRPSLRGPNLVAKPPNFDALMDKVSNMMKNNVKVYNQQSSQQKTQHKTIQIKHDQPFKEFPLSFNSIQTRKNTKNPFRPQQQQQYETTKSQTFPTRSPTVSPQKVQIYFDQMFTTEKPSVKEIRNTVSPPQVNLVEVKATLPPSPANKGRSLPKSVNQNEDDDGFYGVFDPPAFGKPFTTVGPSIQQLHNDVDQHQTSDAGHKNGFKISQFPISLNQSPIDVPHQPTETQTMNYQNVRSPNFENVFAQQQQQQQQQPQNEHDSQHQQSKDHHQNIETTNSFLKQITQFDKQSLNTGHFNREIPLYEIDIAALHEQQKQFHHQQSPSPTFREVPQQQTQQLDDNRFTEQRHHQPIDEHRFDGQRPEHHQPLDARRFNQQRHEQQKHAEEQRFDGQRQEQHQQTLDEQRFDGQRQEKHQQATDEQRFNGQRQEQHQQILDEQRFDGQRQEKHQQATDEQRFNGQRQEQHQQTLDEQRFDGQRQEKHQQATDEQRFDGQRQEKHRQTIDEQRYDDQQKHGSLDPRSFNGHQQGQHHQQFDARGFNGPQQEQQQLDDNRFNGPSQEQKSINDHKFNDQQQEEYQQPLDPRRFNDPQPEQHQQHKDDDSFDDQQQEQQNQQTDDYSNNDRQQEPQTQSQFPQFPPKFPGEHQKSVSPIPLTKSFQTTIDEPYIHSHSPTPPTLFKHTPITFENADNFNQQNDEFGGSFEDDYQSDVTTLTPVSRTPVLTTFTRSPTVKPSYEKRFPSSKPAIKSIIAERPVHGASGSRASLRKLQFGSRLRFTSTTGRPYLNRNEQFDNTQYVEPDSQHDWDTNDQQQGHAPPQVESKFVDERVSGGFKEYDQEQGSHEGQKFDDRIRHTDEPDDEQQHQNTDHIQQHTQRITAASYDSDGSDEQISHGYHEDSKSSKISRKPLPSPEAFQQFHYQPVKTKTETSRTSSYIGKSAKSR